MDTRVKPEYDEGAGSSVRIPENRTARLSAGRSSSSC